MNCLTLREPWASLLVMGVKIMEGRSWKPKELGTLWIHSGKSKPTKKVLNKAKTFYPETAFPNKYSFGHILGCVGVVEVITQQEYINKYNRDDCFFKYAWVCTNAKKLKEPIPFSGRLRIYKLPKGQEQMLKNAEFESCRHNRTRHNLNENSDSDASNQEVLYHCRYCRKVFTSTHTRTRHELDHVGVKSFICTNCNAKFKYKSSLNRHTCKKQILLHECDHCDLSYATGDDLVQHTILRHKEHLNAKPYECFNCGVSFKKRKHLRNHVSFEKDELMPEIASTVTLDTKQSSIKPKDELPPRKKSYECNDCGTQFSSKKLRRKHDCSPMQEEAKAELKAKMKPVMDKQDAAKDNDNSYECNECGTQFASKKLRRNHHCSQMKEKAKPQLQAKFNDLASTPIEATSMIHEPSTSAPLIEPIGMTDSQWNLESLQPIELAKNIIQEMIEIRTDVIASNKQNGRIQCDTCHNLFATKRAKRKHDCVSVEPEKIPLPKKPIIDIPIKFQFGCSQCGEIFDSQEQLRTHHLQTNHIESMQNFKQISIQNLLNTFVALQVKPKSMYSHSISQPQQHYRSKDYDRLMPLTLITEQQYSKMLDFLFDQLVQDINDEAMCTDVIFDQILPEWLLLIYSQYNTVTRQQALI